MTFDFEDEAADRLRGWTWGDGKPTPGMARWEFVERLANEVGWAKHGTVIFAPGEATRQPRR